MSAITVPFLLKLHDGPVDVSLLKLTALRFKGTQPLGTKLLLKRGRTPDPWLPRRQCPHHLVLRVDQTSGGR